MFLEFYNLREQPFGVTPDPRFLYLSPTHREALASLVYGVQSNRGFMTLVARPGMGKTTLLYCLLDRLRSTARTAFLFQTQSTPVDLLRQLLADLGAGECAHDMVSMHQQLNQFLAREAENRRQVVAIIDEAQNLSDEVLESIRLLSNFETPRVKLIQIILAGQPPLADKLAQPSLSQLCQRLSVMARLDPFDRAETDLYISHRLRVGGYTGNLLFSPEARTLIALLSKGTPRLINHLCFNALSIGFAMRKSVIDCSIVREAAADLNIAALGSEGSEVEASPRNRSYEISAPSSGSEGPKNQGAHPDVAAVEPKSSPSPSLGGDRPQTVSRVMPGMVGMVSRAPGSRALRWALRAATVGVALFLLSLIPTRILDINTPSRVPAKPAQGAVEAAPANRVAMPAPVSMAASAEPEPTTDEEAPSQTSLRREERKAVRPDTTPRVSARPAPATRATASAARGTTQKGESMLSLRSDPQGADVHIDGADYGQTPLDTVLAPGIHTYRVDLAGHAPYENMLNLQPGTISTKTLTFGLGSGTVDVRSVPPGAQIAVDGVVRGKTPAQLQVDTGEHNIEVILSGYQTAHESVEAQAGQTLQIYKILSPQ